MEALREAGHEVVEFDRCGRADGKASADPLECAGDLDLDVRGIRCAFNFSSRSQSVSPCFSTGRSTLTESEKRETSGEEICCSMLF